LGQEVSERFAVYGLEFLRRCGSFCQRVDGRYWSATSVTDNPRNARLVFFDTGKPTFAFKTITFHVWCVRGTMPAGQY
jgi:hypothetical protein